MPDNIKSMILSTFLQLAKTNSVDKITVKNLVETCGISRQSFYYHFQDILSVMELTVRQMIQTALRNSLGAESPEKSIEEFIRVSVENHDLLEKLLSSQWRAQIEHIFVDAMHSSFLELIRVKQPDLAVTYQDLNLALNFYTYGTIGIILEYCKNPEINIEQISRKLYKILSGKMLDL